MLNKLEDKSDKIPTPSRDEVMSMFKTAWDEATAFVDTDLVFKQNAITINLDGFEDHLVSTNLSTLVMKEMKEFRETLLKLPVPNSLKKLKKLIIPLRVCTAMLHHLGIQTMRATNYLMANFSTRLKRMKLQTRSRQCNRDRRKHIEFG